MLKADIHLHAGEDSSDRCPYSARELVDLAYKNGFEVLSFTFHNQLFYPKSLVDYAKKKNILLIPGCEMKIEDAHVLIYHHDYGKLKECTRRILHEDKLSSIRKNKQDCLVMAPHPFYLIHSLMGRLKLHMDAFDAVEYSHYYYHCINLNRKAERVALEAKKPMVGTSDLHRLYHFNYTYSLIESDKNARNVLDAIRQGKVVVKTRSLPFHIFLWLGVMNTLQRT